MADFHIFRKPFTPESTLEDGLDVITAARNFMKTARIDDAARSVLTEAFDREEAEIRSLMPNANAL
jgi:hypothetical protein